MKFPLSPDAHTNEIPYKLYYWVKRWTADGMFFTSTIEDIDEARLYWHDCVMNPENFLVQMGVRCPAADTPTSKCEQLLLEEVSGALKHASIPWQACVKG